MYADTVLDTRAVTHPTQGRIQGRGPGGLDPPFVLCFLNVLNILLWRYFDVTFHILLNYDVTLVT
jgi:hypothetical protein